jgi:putative membrane protein
VHLLWRRTVDAVADSSRRDGGRAPRSPGGVEGWAIVGIVLVVLAWSAISPHDWPHWLAAAIWVFAGLAAVLAMWRRFPLTRLVAWLLALFAVVLLYGGHHTYAETPLGDWAQQRFGLARNHFDRFAHFLQGFVLALLIRELLLRLGRARETVWLVTLVASLSLAIAAFFEFLEWWTAVIMGTSAEATLETQGDVWDTQKDMFLALAASLIALLLLTRWHDLELRRDQRSLGDRRPVRLPATDVQDPDG